MYVYMYSYTSTGYGCQSCSWSAEQGKWIDPCLRSRLRNWFRETVLRLNMVLNLRDSSRVPRRRLFNDLNRHTPSGQSRVNRVTQLRIDGVHCRESAGTGPVNLKVVPNGCCLGRSSPCCCCCCCLHIKSRSGLYSVLSSIRTGPTDADAFRGHRLTTQKGYTYQKKIKGPRKVSTHAIV